MVAKSIAKIYTNIHKPTDYYRLSYTSCHLYVAFACFYCVVTYYYVIWTEGVSEINY